MHTESRHQCLIYSGSPSEQLPVLSATLQQKLKDNYRCLYLNSPSMVAGLRSQLSALGIDVAHEIEKSRLVLSSDTVVSSDGSFNMQVMLQKLEEAVEQALQDGFKGLFATGDMTWELGSSKDSFRQLLEYEWALEKLFQKQAALHGICQYHYDTLPIQIMRDALVSHRAIFVSETLSYINQHYIESMTRAAQEAKNPALNKAINNICELRENPPK